MATNTKYFALFGVFLFLFFTFITVSHATTINAVSPSYSDVSTAISNANPGDTVIIPAGSATWESRLTITKGITLQGSSATSTVITAGVDGSGIGIDDRLYLIVYDPASPSNNESFRLTGFTFDCAGRIQALKLKNETKYALNKIRVDHNKFINGKATTRFLLVYGTVYGVIDNNYIEKNNSGSILDGYALNEGTWNNLTFSYGTADNMYFENNTIANLRQGAHDIGLGGRLAIRYNTYIHNSANGIYSWLIMHDDQPGSHYSPMGAEFYGNMLSSTFPSSLCGYRGGKLLFFYNKVSPINPNATYSFSVNELFPDYAPKSSCFSDNAPNGSCDSDDFVTSPDGQPQHVSSGYIWNNRKNTTLILPRLEKECCSGLGGYGPWADCCYNNDKKSGILEDSDWWRQKDNFDGTSGVGCGTLASRPTTCTPGVAYWATEQSCLELEGLVGANPTTPISGVLYKCIAPNTWMEYYKPYIYPHPLTLVSSAPDSPRNFRFQ